jgi:hypothetical protein
MADAERAALRAHLAGRTGSARGSCDCSVSVAKPNTCSYVRVSGTNAWPPIPETNQLPRSPARGGVPVLSLR